MTKRLHSTQSLLCNVHDQLTVIATSSECTLAYPLHGWLWSLRWIHRCCYTLSHRGSTWCQSDVTRSVNTSMSCMAWRAADESRGRTSTRIVATVDQLLWVTYHWHQSSHWLQCSWHGPTTLCLEFTTRAHHGWDTRTWRDVSSYLFTYLPRTTTDLYSCFIFF